MTLKDQYYQFTLGKSKFPMKPLIDLESGLSYVYGVECKGSDVCRKGDEPPLFDITANNPTILPDTFTYKFAPNEELTGNTLADIFTIGGVEVNTTFGCIKRGTKSYSTENMTFGLGFETDPNPNFIEPVKSIMNSVDQKGIIIMNGQNAGDGNIVFGALTHSSCENMIMTKAQISGKGQQTWQIKFTSITSGSHGDYDVNAAFDFTTDEITLTKSLYEGIGIDSVPFLGKLDDIVFKIDDYTITLKPKDYTIKTNESRFLPRVKLSDKDSQIRLGASFYRNRCIYLRKEDDQYKIGISQLESNDSHLHFSTISLLAVFLIGNIHRL
ncbi:hypothetical protein M3Y97_00139100 [Aphelenchoides bicaudatus]|nr:hypothetical protein M3Y97_00139100 [Aphelenchoides bicaudatus]